MSAGYDARSTSPSTVSRTAAATAARRRASVGRIALELACRLGDLDDERLAALAAVVLAEVDRRMLGVPDLDAHRAR